MKKNPVVPLAVVLAIGAAWTMLTQGGKKPLTVNMNPLGKSMTETRVRAELPSLADDIAALFSGPDDAIHLEGVSCQGALCTAELQGDADSLRRKIEGLVQENPWLGTWKLERKAGEERVFLAIFQPVTRS